MNDFAEREHESDLLVPGTERFSAADRAARAPRFEGSDPELASRFHEPGLARERERANLLRFLSCVAHDLRNSICVLRMSTTPSSRPLSPRRIRRTLDLVRRQLDGLDRMAGDLLDVTRIEAGQLELRIEDRDASALAAGVVELYRAGAAQRLTLAIPEHAVPVRCDPLRIEQVLCNLVSNAIRYSAASSPIQLSVMREGSEAVFSVLDRGIGIEPADLARIFEPFHRGGPARPASASSGLGLSATRRIVEAHGGRIEVESAPGQGSLFRVRLPRARDRGT